MVDLLGIDLLEKHEPRLPSRLAKPDAAFTLMLATLRWPDDAERRAAIAAAALTDIDWDRFLALAARHRVMPLALQGLATASVSVPCQVGSLFGEGLRGALFAELQMASEFSRLQRLFRQNSIEPVALKGPAQSLRSFGRLGLRTNLDIDILVGADEVDRAQALMLEAGYALLEPSTAPTEVNRQRWVRDHKDMSFGAPESGVLVELHWRLFDNSALMPLNGSPAPVPLGLAPLADSLVLPDELNFRYLCYHGALHGWSRLKWLADTSALLPSLDADMIRRAYLPDGARAEHAVGQALILCQHLLDARLPPDVEVALQKSSRARWLARLAWSQIVKCDTAELEKRRFGSTIKNASHYALHDGWRYWYEELRFDLNVTPRSEASAAGRSRHRLHDWLRRRVALL